MDASHKTMVSNERITNMKIFEHDTDSAISISNDLNRRLRTADLIKAFYQFRQEMLDCIQFEIHRDPMTIVLSDGPEVKTQSTFQLLRECERRGLALDKF